MVSVKAVMAVWTPLTLVPGARDAADGHVHGRRGETAQELGRHKLYEHPTGDRSLGWRFQMSSPWSCPLF
jgi:hypothetical protein